MDTVQFKLNLSFDRSTFTYFTSIQNSKAIAPIVELELVESLLTQPILCYILKMYYTLAESVLYSGRKIAQKNLLLSISMMSSHVSNVPCSLLPRAAQKRFPVESTTNPTNQYDHYISS